MDDKKSGEKLITWLSELVATRLCHDLAGPIGGINNGVEFLAEGGEDMVEGAAELLALSATEARAKLQFFRMAYGVINAEGNADPKEVLSILEDYFKNTKIKVQWQINESAPFTAAMRRVLANMVLVASSALIMGGQLKIAIFENEMRVEGTGPKIKQEEELPLILNNPLNPTAVPASKHAPAALLSFHAGGEKNIRFRIDQSIVVISVNLPVASNN